MKSTLLTLGPLAVAALVMQCSPKNSEYLIPENMNPSSKQSLVSYLDRGKLLYGQFCSECHGINGGGKENIPNFSHAQLDIYQAKISMSAGKNHGMVDSLSYAEVESILNYLRFRKKEVGK
ncbi:MAG: c-type cytochrome [Saprospiraceae bacterium]|nr:c-type cytochrome [Saprospiraceae bacterium]